MKNCALTINGFELPVFLGWPDAERQQPQTVRIDLIVQFATTPEACTTDQLQDTFCYDKLLARLREKITDKEYRLIEHLASDIHTLLKSLLPHDAKLKVSLLKFPAINGLTGGVTFSYGD